MGAVVEYVATLVGGIAFAVAGWELLIANATGNKEGFTTEIVNDLIVCGVVIAIAVFIGSLAHDDQKTEACN